MANPKLCSIPDCGKRHYGRGWCSKHYKRWFKFGDPMLCKRIANGEAERYFNEVVLAYEGDECLNWPYATANGYGTIYYNGQMTPVSRLVCERVNGPPPTPKHEAAHSCGKGHEACVAKRHLSWKTRTENQADRTTHGTHNHGERHGMSKLTTEQARAIYALKGKLTHQKIADQFGISRRTVWRIHNRKGWAWLH